MPKEMMGNRAIDLARISEVLDYDKETGLFAWKKKMNRRIQVGSSAGTTDQKGRITICIDGQKYLAHRLAWVYCYGATPDGQIDHFNGNPGDNRLSNLRTVTPLGNSQNRRAPGPISKSGLLGAAKGRRGKWVAVIKIDGKAKYLGEFQTPEAAHEAYVAAKRKFHPTCTI